LKILFVLNSFFPEQKAGTEQYVLSLIQGLNQKSIDCAVLIPTNTQIENYIYEGISVFTFPISANISRTERIGMPTRKSRLIFKETVSSFSPQIVHFQNFNRSIPSYYLKLVKRLGIKTLYTPHLAGSLCLRSDFIQNSKSQCSTELEYQKCLNCYSEVNGINSKLFQFLTKVRFPKILTKGFALLYTEPFLFKLKKMELENIKKYADGVIAIAPWIQKAFSLNKVQTNLIRTGIQEIQISNEKLFTQTLPIQLIYVGRIYPLKGLDVFLEALSNLRIDEIKDFNITIISPDFPNDDYAKKCVDICRKFNQINLKYDLTQSEVREEMNHAHAIIVPSQSEVAPLVVLEALSMKLPVIGSKIPAITDLISHEENGFLFERNNSNELVEILKKIIVQPELLKQCSNNIDQVTTSKEMVNQTIKIYNKISKSN
jgi:glycosyltransferase involved in cell wall biosynthesis